NFRKLVQQNLLEEDVSLKSFEELLSNADYENIIIDNFSNEKKLNSLLVRLEYYTPKNEQEKIKTLKILSVLLNNPNKYDYKILRLINNIAGEEKFYLNNQEFIIKDFLGENSILSNYNKLILIGDIWEAKNENKLWGVSLENFENVTIHNFQSYLNEHNNESIWEAGDYTFFGVFHSIKNIKITETNQLIKDYWSKNNLEILLSQMISIPNLTKGVYALSNVTDLIFGSKKEFTEFILNHKDISTPAGKEISKFLELSQIVEFKRGVCFDFTENKSIIKAQIKRENENRYRNLRIKQVFFKIDSQLLADAIHSKYLGALTVSFHWYEGSHYIVVEIPIGNLRNEFVGFTQRVYEIAKNELDWNKLQYIEGNVLNKKVFLINEDPKASMVVSSIQPKIKKPRL
ncbi:MAG: hypothetical protein ACPGVD_09055, partial [Flavobacteriales bacterium]